MAADPDKAPRFFRSRAAFRAWLAKHRDRVDVLWLAKVARLKAAGLMAPAGLAAFESRDPKRANLYAFENPQALPQEYEKRFRAKKKAWTFFEAQPPGYRRLMAHWVASAKREETRERRLAQLVEASGDGRRIE